MTLEEQVAELENRVERLEKLVKEAVRLLQINEEAL
jgi:hypothetical protein